MDELPPDKAKNGRPTAYCDDIANKIIDAVRSGLTMERAAELVGMNPGTIQGWVSKRPTFGRAIKKARREHEVSLLRSIELAGEKSWQARAWLAERVHGYAMPSARLQVSADVHHNAGAGFAQLLAGLASRRAEKKAQVIDSQVIKPIEDTKSKYNTYCATDTMQTIVTPTPSQNEKASGKARHVRMKRRKPRGKAMDTTTPPA
ncbi:MAG: helix-turn-helix domain-containing protein, partial [Verrucomicrobia bacterium]|nr:helix-turn-helix domain-containing protein [Verrucomicrobiota bacterium]